jgi:hypothetical protein
MQIQRNGNSKLVEFGGAAYSLGMHRAVWIQTDDGPERDRGAVEYRPTFLG